MVSPKGEPGVDLEALVKQIMQDPALAQKVNKRAEDYRSDVLATWPTEDKTVKDSGDFSHKKPGKAFVVVNTTAKDGRPVSIVEVRHPHAVAHQARTGAFTKAAGKTFNERW